MKEFIAVALSSLIGALSVATVMLSRKANKAEREADEAEIKASSSKSQLEGYKGAKEASDRVEKRDVDEKDRSDFDNDW